MKEGGRRDGQKLINVHAVEYRKQWREEKMRWKEEKAKWKKNEILLASFCASLCTHQH